MNTLVAQWQQWVSRFAALKFSERRLIGLAAVLGVALLGYALLIDPLWAKARATRMAVEDLQRSEAEAVARLNVLQAQLKADPDAAAKAELARLQAAIQESDAHLSQLNESLVPPEEMNGLLEFFLKKQVGLKLVSLKTLPPESILAPAGGEEKEKNQKPASRQFDLLKHGVELRLEGRYPDLLAYVEQLEKAERKLLWGKMELKAGEYPKSVLTIVVYTLGTDKAWLAI